MNRTGLFFKWPRSPISDWTLLLGSDLIFLTHEMDLIFFVHEMDLICGRTYEKKEWRRTCDFQCALMTPLQPLQREGSALPEGTALLQCSGRPLKGVLLDLD